MSVPLNDLSRHWRVTEPLIRPAMERVLASGWFVLGPAVEAFQSDFAAYCGVSHCVGVANGTDALELALRALDCTAGDEVVTVANAGMYASAAIRAVGAMPRFVDIDPVRLTMAPAALEMALAVPVKAVVVTHLYGRLADMMELLAVADAHGVPVIEDCAQAHGASRGGRRAGAWGTVGCFSFYPTKNLGAIGDSGAVVTDNDGLAATLKSLREYGWERKYHADLPGGRNSRLDELQAAVLGAKLPLLDEMNASRRAVAARYAAAMADCDLILPPEPDAADAAHLFVVRTRARTALRQMLQEGGVATDVHYPVPDHRQAAFSGLPCCAVSLPETERAADEVLTLPCFPEITDAEIETVIAAVREAASSSASVIEGG